MAKRIKILRGNGGSKRIFNSPFRVATTPSDEGSMNSEQRQELLTQYSSTDNYCEIICI